MVSSYVIQGLIVSIVSIQLCMSFTSTRLQASFLNYLNGQRIGGGGGGGGASVLKSSLWDQVVDQWNNVLKSNSLVKEVKKELIDLTIYDQDINTADSILRRAAVDKSTSPDEVIAQLLSLEKLMRLKNKLDGGATSRDTIRNLNGAWRLVFTTGTIDTQKKIGKINYFPIKAVQTFNTATDPYTISNGIYVGKFPLLRWDD